MESREDEARAGMWLGLSAPNRGEGTFIFRPGVEMRGCWSSEGIRGLPAAGIRENAVDAARDGGGFVGVSVAGSSSSTMTQFRRSSSFSYARPVCLLLAAGCSGAVSGSGS